MKHEELLKAFREYIVKTAKETGLVPEQIALTIDKDSLYVERIKDDGYTRTLELTIKEIKI